MGKKEGVSDREAGQPLTTPASRSPADVFSDFTLARQGYPRMAFSACFGGIIFSILHSAWASVQAHPQGCNSRALSFPLSRL